MQKYKLVFKPDFKQEEVIITLKGSINEYEDVTEICFIDLFTSAFQTEQDCINYLSQNGIVSGKGTLHIKRPRGNKDTTDIVYADEDFRRLIIEVCNKIKQGMRTTLSETNEYKKIVYGIIKFFYSDDEVILDFENSFFSSPSFVESLRGYMKYKNHAAFFTPYEIADREKNKQRLFNILKKYETLREVKLWVTNYERKKEQLNISNSRINPLEEHERKKGQLVFSNSRINPFEEYERKKDEQYEKINSL